MTTHTMPLSFTKPPITWNYRGHWAKKAKITKTIRDEIHVRAQAARLPRNLGHITVTFHYQPGDNRHRDTDNLGATTKPIFDALAAGTRTHPGYGMVKDDTPQYMTKPEPIIHPPVKGEPKCWLVIKW